MERWLDLCSASEEITMQRLEAYKQAAGRRQAGKASRNKKGWPRQPTSLPRLPRRQALREIPQRDLRADLLRRGGTAVRPQQTNRESSMP
jgi:hypothetical protein